MHINGFRLAVIGVAVLFTLAVLMAGQHLVENRTVDQPLEELYRAHPAVETFAINETPEQLEISIKLKRIDNLPQSYRELEEKTRAILGDRQFRLTVEDERNRDLEEVYYHLHYDLEEGVATGHFSMMAERVEKKARALGVGKYKLYVDENYVYLALYQEDGYLYELIPRGVNANRTLAKTTYGLEVGGGR